MRQQPKLYGLHPEVSLPFAFHICLDLQCTAGRHSMPLNQATEQAKQVNLTWNLQYKEHKETVAFVATTCHKGVCYTGWDDGTVSEHLILAFVYDHSIHVNEDYIAISHRQ
jgi:hypothetical protein